MQKCKRIKATTGVYKICNLINGKMYIGSSKNLVNRATNHRKNLKDNKHSNKHLQSSYNKYGGENFIFEVIEYCDNYVEREQYWMDLFDVNNPKKGYNKRLKAETNSGRRFKLSDEHRKKISIRQLARRDEIAKWASEFHKGKIVSKETKNRMSKAQKGRVISEETKRKISKSTMKKVIDYTSGKIWENSKSCAEELNVSSDTIRNWIKGRHKSIYNLSYIKI